MTINQTTEKILQWHWARNLIVGADDLAQYEKLHEEQGELLKGIRTKNVELIEDSIGDMYVVLVNIAERNGLTMEQCINTAYEEIKDRRGVMIDGVFHKDV